MINSDSVARCSVCLPIEILVKQRAIVQVKVHTFLVTRLLLTDIAIHNRLLTLARFLSYANSLYETTRA